MKSLWNSEFTAATLRHVGLSVLRLGLAASLLVSAMPLAAIALEFMPPEYEFVPPNRGIPGRREGGGTRGCWGNPSNSLTASRLTALVPSDTFGYTLEATPSFFIYIPSFFAEKAVAAEFELVNAAGDRIYQATYQTSQQSGLIRINLPDDANFAGLTVGEDYNWAFSLVCDLDDPSGNLVVDSWVRRIEPDAALADRLPTAAPTEIPALYAQSGIWYDMLTSLADLSAGGDRLANLDRWQTLLEAVELEAVAQELAPDPVGVLSAPDEN